MNMLPQKGRTMKQDIMIEMKNNMLKRKVSINRMMSLLSVAFLVLHSSLFVSCSALDDAPDNRTEIDNADKVRKLLTSAYPVATPAVICELGGDNFVDNNVVLKATHNDAYSLFHEEAYQWKDIMNYNTSEQDTPYQVWEAYYAGIAVANHAINAMRQMSKDPAHDPEFSHSWGEAHVLRAYLHFVLVNVFAEAYKDEAQSANDWGIPYVQEVEETVSVDYSDTKYRKSVAEVYRLIEEDILEGINLIDDSKYLVPAYHFNRNAANAFAARFYLFKRDYEKCVKYANAALGSNPASMLRKWASLNTNTMDSRLNDYNDEKAACNFLIQSTYSLQDRMLSTCRFAINTGNSDYNVPSTVGILYNGGGPNWSGYLPAYAGNLFLFGKQEYGIWLFRVYEYFEYTDKIAGIGFVHILYQPFTAEETLLCRAEAKLYLGDRAGAIQDLDYWTSSKMIDKPLDQAGINNKYRGTSANNIYISELHPQDMSDTWPVLAEDEMRVLHCILHFRRIETMFEGMRWFDIKRYGITVKHAYRGPAEDEVHQDVLQWNDPRRVFQIPQNVVKAGYPSTDRSVPSLNQTGSLATKPTQLTIN